MDAEEYILSHIDAEPEYLHRLYRETNLTRLYPRMCSGHYQGRVLAMITRMISPSRILELGTFTGYSALCLAEGAPAGAVVDTVEIDDEYADNLRELFKTSPNGEKIRLHICDALEYMKGCGAESYDMIFIDANKRFYPEYYREARRLVRQGGFIIADNTLWGDKVGEKISDDQTRGIERFNAEVRDDSDVEKIILPLRDGLTIIRKK